MVSIQSGGIVKMSKRWSDKQRGEFVRAVRALEEIISAYTIYYADADTSHVSLPENLNPEYYDNRLDGGMKWIKDILNDEMDEAQ